MDEALLAEYRASTYLVCIDRVQWAAIHLDQPLPASLQALAGTRTWAFITAWNPDSMRRVEASNLAAQHSLLRELGGATADVTILPAIGIGPTGWYEPSLFVVGPEFGVFDALGNAYRQNAYVRGSGAGQATLHILAT